MTSASIKLHGFSVSNYYNFVKIALLEKQVPFDEVLNWATKDDATLLRSPLGKVPFLETEQGWLAESRVIAEWVEDAYPQPALMPTSAFERAKVREIVAFMELYLELVARRLYPEAFFGGKVSDSLKEATRKELERNIAAFAKLAKFSPYVMGDAFSLADCAAVVHLPLVSACTKRIYGEDMLASLNLGGYLALTGERASIKRVNDDRKVNAKQMAERAAMSRS